MFCPSNLIHWDFFRMIKTIYDNWISCLRKLLANPLSLKSDLQYHLSRILWLNRLMGIYLYFFILMIILIISHLIRSSYSTLTCSTVRILKRTQHDTITFLDSIWFMTFCNFLVSDARKCNTLKQQWMY